MLDSITLQVLAAVGLFVGLVAMGVPIGLFRASLTKLTVVLTGLDTTIQTQAETQAAQHATQLESNRVVAQTLTDVARVVTELSMLHTPERSGGAGFGTVELREELTSHRHAFDKFEATYEADRRTLSEKLVAIESRLSDLAATFRVAPS